MRYKLIAVDMDGTLLNDEKEITPLTIKAIKEATKKGVIFTISTGRSIKGVEKYNKILHLSSPIITYNGASIVKADTKEVLFSKNLLDDDALKILKYGNERNITMCIWAHDNLYCNVLNELTDDYKKLSDVEPILNKDFESLSRFGISKILWYSDVKTITRVEKELKGVMFENVNYCTSKQTFLEFFNGDVSKARAMEKIGKIYGIKKEEMIAIGDGDNDLSMIEYAGLGVAMSNSSENVKKHAEYVTKNSNNFDGVGEVINKFVLEK